MTFYVCRNRDQHGRTKLGEFTVRDVAWVETLRAKGDPVAASIAESRREAEAAGHTYELVDPDGILTRDHKITRYLTNNVVLSAERTKTRELTDTGRIEYSYLLDKAVARFLCPKCGRDRKIREQHLIAALSLAEVDISAIP